MKWNTVFCIRKNKKRRTFDSPFRGTYWTRTSDKQQTKQILNDIVHQLVALFILSIYLIFVSILWRLWSNKKGSISRINSSRASILFSYSLYKDLLKPFSLATGLVWSSYIKHSFDLTQSGLSAAMLEKSFSLSTLFGKRPLKIFPY